MTSQFARDLAAVAEPASDASPVPAWVRELGPRRRRWFAPRMIGALAAAAMAAAAIVLFVVPRNTGLGIEPTPITAVKGGVEVGVFVKRDGEVFLWDTETPLRAGDAIRLRVAPAGFHHITVFHASSGALAPLYQGPIDPDAPTTLDAAWTLDDAEDGDDIIVVLSDEPVSAPDPDVAHWAKRFRLRAATEKP